mmetsp:Transcript_23556/g.50910  ORF Transcript_23556/g.50910 Transcript_23556/m.50910 type:complete len:248 (+) Transcript_23556:2204-2947(+)
MSLASASRCATQGCASGTASRLGRRRVTMACVAWGRWMVANFKAARASSRTDEKSLPGYLASTHSTGSTWKADQARISRPRWDMRRRHVAALALRSGLVALFFSRSASPCTQPAEVNSLASERKGSASISSPGRDRQQQSTFWHSFSSAIFVVGSLLEKLVCSRAAQRTSSTTCTFCHQWPSGIKGVSTSCAAASSGVSGALRRCALGAGMSKMTEEITLCCARSRDLAEATSITQVLRTYRTRPTK